MVFVFCFLYLSLKYGLSIAQALSQNRHTERMFYLPLLKYSKTEKEILKEWTKNAPARQRGLFQTGLNLTLDR